MQNKWIFSCKDEVELILKKIQSDGQKRGYKAQLARAANCQPAYLSQVLRGKAKLTSEQAVGLCGFWDFNENETDFFITLVELGRAGSQILTKTLHKRLLKLIETQQEENKKLQPPPPHHPEKALDYYMDWVVSAVHMALTIPDLNEVSLIADKISADKVRVHKALNVLKELGIVEQKGEKWSLTFKNLHASQKTLFANLHHKNWRYKSSEKLNADEHHNNLHYTSVVSISVEDFLAVRQLLVERINQSQKIVKDSKEEILACITLDWFEI